MFYYKKEELGLVRVEKPEQMPKEEHWAIIIFEVKSQYVPGDERSKQCPGHGYPAHTEYTNSFQYWAARDRQALEDALDYMRLEQEKNTYQEKYGE